MTKVPNNNSLYVSELDCRARGSPLPRLEWLVRERPVLSSYLVDTVMANRDFVEKRVMVRGAGKMHEGLYQCVATNNVGTHNSFVSVVVIKRTKVRKRHWVGSKLYIIKT